VVIKENGFLTLTDAKEGFYGPWLMNSGVSARGLKLQNLKKQIASLLDREPVATAVEAMARSCCCRFERVLVKRGDDFLLDGEIDAAGTEDLVVVFTEKTATINTGMPIC
jgi:hypothetical protein